MSEQSSAAAPPPLLIARIIGAVARRYRVSPRAIMSPRRTADVVRPRQVAMYLARNLTSSSLPKIGRRFGRGHTVVLRSVRLIEKAIKSDEQLRESIAVLSSHLQQPTVEENHEAV